MKLFDMMTTEDIKRLKELDNSLSIALDINDNYQRENKELKERIKKLENSRPLNTMDEVAYRELQTQNEKLKADFARAKEDHQYDNLVHQKELEDFRKGRWDPNFKPLDGSEK